MNRKSVKIKIQLIIRDVSTNFPQGSNRSRNTITAFQVASETFQIRNYAVAFIVSW